MMVIELEDVLETNISKLSLDEIDEMWNCDFSYPAFLSGYINYEQIEAKLEQIGLEN
jgi:hypothetical protein